MLKGIIIIIGIIFFILVPPLFVEVPKIKKIIDLKQKDKAEIYIPTGSNFFLIFVTPKGSNFSGKLIVSNEKNVFRFTINNKTPKTTWDLEGIDRKLYDVYNLTDDMDVLSLFNSGEKYTFKTNFTKKPLNSSLWLFWLYHYF
jgi:hypothetical protein